MVGIGPGSRSHMTLRALEVLERADVVIGYRTYIGLLGDLVEGKEVVSMGMREELARARIAVERAWRGERVAVVSSGDAGVFGMAGPVLEVLAEAIRRGFEPGFRLEVVPGVTSVVAAAALLGAPINSDFAVISLSPLLTPREVILRRVEAAAAADMVIVLLNPIDPQLLSEALGVIRRFRSPDTPVGIVTNAYRDGQKVSIVRLTDVDVGSIDMRTTLIVGNSQSYVAGGFMITPRGYASKYELLPSDWSP